MRNVFILIPTVSKIMPPILLCQLKMSQVDVDGMAVQVEPSRQYSITFCCCATNGSRGEGQSDKMISDMEVWQTQSYHSCWPVTSLLGCFCFVLFCFLIFDRGNKSFNLCHVKFSWKLCGLKRMCENEVDQRMTA